MSAGAASLFASLGSQLMNVAGNAWNSQIAMQRQKEYMTLYGSPEVQMEHMRKAGINPFFAAQKVTGVAGDSPVGVSMQGAPNLAGDMSGFADSNLNPTVEANTQSDTDKNDAITRGQNIANDIEEGTKQYTIQERINRAEMSDDEKRMLRFNAEHQEELFNLNSSEINSKIRHYNSQSSLFDEQQKLVKENIDLVKEQINEVKANMKYLESAAELNDARAEVERLNKQMQQLLIDKAKIENERYEKFDNAPWIVKRYNEIREDKGEEVADEWLKFQNDLIEKFHEAEAKGTANGDPVTRELNTYYDAIEYISECIDESDQLIKELENYLKTPESAFDPRLPQKKAALVHAKKEFGVYSKKLSAEVDNWIDIKKSQRIAKSAADQVREWTGILKDLGTLMVGIGSWRQGNSSVKKLRSTSNSTAPVSSSNATSSTFGSSSVNYNSGPAGPAGPAAPPGSSGGRLDPVIYGAGSIIGN